VAYAVSANRGHSIVHAPRETKIIIDHPNGTTLVQGSVNFIEDALVKTIADVVMLGVASLNNKSSQYVKDYWQQIVVQTGAKRVYVMHHDDFTSTIQSDKAIS
jgi:hypothetical protein